MIACSIPFARLYRRAGQTPGDGNVVRVRFGRVALAGGALQFLSFRRCGRDGAWLFWPARTGSLEANGSSCRGTRSYVERDSGAHLMMKGGIGVLPA